MNPDLAREHRLLEQRIGDMEAGQLIDRQDLKGCEDAFDALNVPMHTPGGDRLRTGGRARQLLTMYRSLYTLAADAIEEAEGDVEAVPDRIASFRERLDSLAPEEP